MVQVGVIAIALLVARIELDVHQVILEGDALTFADVDRRTRGNITVDLRNIQKLGYSHPQSNPIHGSSWYNREKSPVCEADSMEGIGQVSDRPCPDFLHKIKGLLLRRRWQQLFAMNCRIPIIVAENFNCSSDGVGSH